MRKSVLLILLLAFVMQGCKKMDPMTDLDSVIVSSEEFIAEAEDFGPQTKTSLATSRKVVWSEDDRIAIFQGSSLADRFQVSDQSVGNSNGVFSFVGNSGEENGDYSAGTETTLETNVALYPYQDGIECSAITDEEDVVTSYTITGVTIPANQIYAEDSFAEESFIMAAVTEGVVDHNLKFKNVCGAIKLQLKGERTIKSISVAGKGDEVIAGDAVVTVYPDGTAPKVVMDERGEKVITLDCSEDGGVVLSQEEATVFVIAVPPTPFESGFTVTITGVDDNAETFSASPGTSVERSVITVMPEIDLDEEEEITTSAYLPDGSTFNSTVDAFMTGKGITEIKFITNSATTSQDALVDGSIYLVQNGQTLEIHTAAGQFMANTNCYRMFSAYEGWDNSTQQDIYNSFGQILVIDFGENFNTQNVTYMNGMFRDCSSLTSLDLSRFNTQNVTNMGSMFSVCSNLTSLDLSNFDTQNVTDMSVMFQYCTSLTSLDVSNFDTQNVTKMSGMFYKCSSLTSLDLSNFDTQNVTDMRYMFEDCSSLTSLDLSRFNTQNVTNMGSMFSVCSNLTSLDLSNFDTQNVTNMSCMFEECSSLTSLDLSNFDTQNVTNMSDMFGSRLCNNGCSSLTSLDLSNFDTQNVTDMSGMFRRCTSLTSLDLSNFNTQNVTDMFLMFGSCTSLTSLDLSNFDTQNVTNMGSMFSVCSSLTSLDLSNFCTQNVTNMSDMFDYCRSLTSLDLSNFDTQNVTSMRYMFSECSSLTSLDLSNFDTQNVTSMYRMFRRCTSLTSLDLSNFNTQNVTDMERMFCECSSLTSLDLSNFDTQNVTSMGLMFAYCPSLTSLDVSNFTFEGNPNIESMFSSTGSNAANRPIPIYVSEKGKSYIETNGNSSINGNYATLTVKERAYLPDGPTFNSTVDAFMTGKVITEIKFITNSATTSSDVLVENSIYLVKNGETLEIHTAADQFVANSSCIMMFNAHVGWDNSTQQDILNSFGQIQTIDFGDNFNTKNVTNMGSMFDYCSSLTSLDISNFNTQNVTDMWCMFEGCTSLTTLDVRNFDTQKVTDMSSMFSGCSGLTSLDVSNFNTQNVTYMIGMFMKCSGLTSLDLSNFTFVGNPDIELMFSSTGSNATNKPIPIYVSAEGKDYIESKGDSYIDNNYATLTIKAPQGE